MPSCPMEMPSETEMVPNSSGKPPASWTPSLAAAPRRCSDILQGVISFHEVATAICGFTQSSSPMPTARSMPRAAVASRPSVTSRDRGLMSGEVVSVSMLMQACYARFQHPHRSEEHTSELQSRGHLVCRLLLEKKKKTRTYTNVLH